MKNVLISRKDASILLGVSTKQMIRVEKNRNLSNVKLVKTKNGGVYYKTQEIENILKELS